MSFTIETGKETGLIQINVVPKPLILCQLTAVDGDTVYLTTTPALGGSTLTYNGNVYLAKLQSNVIDQIQALSPQGYDIPGSITLTIADGDFAIWLNHANLHGWRGGTLTVTFVLWDAITGAFSTNAYIWIFILDKPNWDSKGVITVAAQARQSMTRLNVPNVPVQNRCSHDFPSTYLQRVDGLTNPTSDFWSCGYSPDVAGGVGNRYAGTTLSSSYTAGATSITVGTITGALPATPFQFTIASNEFLCSAVAGSTWTVAGGQHGTTDANAASSAPIVVVYNSCDFTRSCGNNQSVNPHQGCMARLGYGAVFSGTAWGTGAGDGGGLNAFSIQTSGALSAIAILVGFPVLGLINLLFGSSHGAPAGSTAINLGHLLTFSTVLAGDQFFINGDRYTVTHNFTTDHLGNTPVTFTPPLLTAVPDGTLVYTGSAPDGNITLDTSGRPTARFDGDTWLAPVGWSGKQYVNPSAGTQYGFNATNPATGTTYYNQGYGTQWVTATVLAPAGDPNSTRAECVVCVAPVGPATINLVLVNGVQIQPDNPGDYLFTYYVRSAGGRQGAVNGDAPYNNQGDPHGSLCYIEIVVPVELATSSSIPNVQVQVQFPQCLHAMPIATAAVSGSSTLITFAAGVTNIDLFSGTVFITGNSTIPNGAYTVTAYTGGPPGTITISGIAVAGTGGSAFYYPANTADAAMVESSTGAVAANPVWALMDLLTWGPFTCADFDVQSWYNAAQICAEQISYNDINGAAQTHARYRCSFALQTNNRMSLAKAVLGVRNCAGIILGRNPVNGLLQCFIEQTLADQQPAPIAGSNYNTAVSSVTAAGATANGYLAYLFDGAGSIENGTFKMGGRSLNDTPNTVSFPFQDSANAWVQDSITTIDAKGYVSSGNQEIQAQLQILGIETFDQGTRRSNVELAKALYGNARFDSGGTELPSFRTTVKAAHLASRVGFICGINYEQAEL